MFAWARTGNVAGVDSNSAVARDDELAAFLAAPAPRRVPERFAKKAQAQFAGWGVLMIGTFFGFMGLVFAVAMQPWRLLDDWRLAREIAATAPGQIVVAETANLAINRVHIWRYDFTFSVSGRETTASCYAAQGRWRVGDAVTVRYLPNDPAMAIAEGGHRSRGGGGFHSGLLVFIGVGFGVLVWAIRQRRRALHLLTNGRLDEAIVESVTPTGTKVNGRRVQKIKLRGICGGAGVPITVRFHAPEIVALAESRLASGQPVYLLRDPARPNHVILPEAL